MAEYRLNPKRFRVFYSYRVPLPLMLFLMPALPHCCPASPCLLCFPSPPLRPHPFPSQCPFSLFWSVSLRLPLPPALSVSPLFGWPLAGSCCTFLPPLLPFFCFPCPAVPLCVCSAFSLFAAFGFGQLLRFVFPILLWALQPGSAHHSSFVFSGLGLSADSPRPPPSFMPFALMPYVSPALLLWESLVSHTAAHL